MPAQLLSPPDRIGNLTPNALGAIYMTIGSLGYVLNDALVRQATEAGLDVYQALFLRTLTIVGVFVLLIAAGNEPVRRSDFTRPVVVRVIAEVIAGVLFFAAIVHVEFANAQTILLVLPFAVTLAAAIFLGERVSGRQYATILFGFLGVVLVVQPATGEFSGWSLVILASALTLVVRELATKRIPLSVPTTTIALATAVAMSALTGLLSVIRGWGPLSTSALVSLGFAVVSLTIGYLFTIQTVRVGDLSVSAPFRYTQMLGAVVFGYLFFSEVPNNITLAGCGVILVAGLYAIRIERQIDRSRSTANL